MKMLNSDTKLESDLIWFSKIQPPKPLNAPSPDFDQMVRRSGRLCILSAQIMGYFPFSVDSKNKLRFGWASVPAFMVVFQLSVMVVWVSLFRAYEEEFGMVFKPLKKGDNIGYMFVAFANCYGESYLRLLGLYSRQRVSQTWEDLQILLNEIYLSASASSRIHFEKELERKTKKSKVIFGLLLVLVIFFCITTAESVYEPVFCIVPSFGGIAFGTGLIFWNSQTLLSTTKTLSLVHIMELISIGFSVLTQEAKASRPQHRLFLKHYEGLEGIVQAFNNRFAVELIFTLSSICCVLLNLLYVLSGNLADGIRDADAFVYTFPGILINGAVAFLLCSFGTRVTTQAQSAAILFHRHSLRSGMKLDSTESNEIQAFMIKATTLPAVISPGNFFIINRGLISTGLGALVTYIVVLLQFRGGPEK